MNRVVVLGGGLSGLSAACALSKNGFKTFLLEEDDELGGLASSYLIDGQYVPKTYHHVMYGDDITLRTIADLGLSSALYWRKLKVGFYSEGKFYDFSSPFSIMKFKPLSLLGRIRFGLMVSRARRRASWEDLDGLDVEDYALSAAGKEAYKLVDYIVQAKFAETPANISAAWLMSRFGHESKSVSNQFGYLKGGIEQVIRRLAASCMKSEGVIKTGARVTRIATKNGQIDRVEYEEDRKAQEVKSDIVVTTMPIPVLLDVSDELPENYTRSLRNIRYKASLCITFAFSERVSPFYWLNIMDLQKHPFAGAFEHSYLNNELKWPSTVYTIKYLDVKDSFWIKSDQEIAEEFLMHLAGILDCDLKEKLLWWRLHRAEYSTPVFVPSYGKLMPQAKSPIEGLYIGGISRTYPRDRYMGTAILTGIEAAEAVLADCKSR
jgi:protoporphyrinogen oxidase